MTKNEGKKQSALTRLLKAERLTQAAVSRVLDYCLPLVLLWPWFLGNLILCAFLTSSQGAALAEGFQYEPISRTVVVFVTGLSFVIVLASCLVTAHVAQIRDDRRPDYFEATARAWSVVLASAPGLLLGAVTGSLAAFATSIGLGSLLFWRLKTRDRMRRERAARTMLAAHPIGRHAVFIGVLLTLACVPLLLGAQIAVHRPDILDAIGPLLLLMYCLSALSSALGNILVAAPACTPRPWFVRVLLLAWCTYSNISRPFAPDRLNPLLEKERIRAQTSGNNCGEDFSDIATILTRQLMREKPKPLLQGQRDDKHPLYLVSAAGGGIRAAYWTAVGLTELDIATNNQFGNEVASLSGVSGGSLGIATWIAAREVPSLTPQERLAHVRTFLSSDFLSPLLAGIFFLDAPRLLFGRVWETSTRDQVFEKALAHRWERLTSSNFFVRPLNKMCLKSFQSTPVVVFNATDALTGGPIPLGNTFLNSANPLLLQDRNAPAYHYAPDDLKHLSIAQAVHISARFPFLSPGADFADNVTRRLTKEYGNIVRQQTNEKGELSPLGRQFKGFLEKLQGDEIFYRSYVLVDGGYFDNSGLGVSRKIIEFVDYMQKGELRQRVVNGPFNKATTVVVHFDNNPEQTCLPPEAALNQASEQVRHLAAIERHRFLCQSDVSKASGSLSPRPFQWLTTPIEAMLSVRESHAAQELVRVGELQFTRAGGQLYEFSLSKQLSSMFGFAGPKASAAPLDWRSKGVNAYVADAQKATEDALTHGAISEGEAASRLETLRRWQNVALTYEERLTCSKQMTIRQAPLGWVLDHDNRELLACAAAHAAIEISAQQPPAFVTNSAPVWTSGSR